MKEKLLVQYEDDPTFGEFLKASEKGVKGEGGAAVLAAEIKESSSEAEEEEEEEHEDKLAQKRDISDQDVSTHFFSEGFLVLCL